MLAAPATQRNLKQLEDDGVSILGPGSGQLACGDVGEGRLVQVREIHDLILQLLDV